MEISKSWCLLFHFYVNVHLKGRERRNSYNTTSYSNSRISRCGRQFMTTLEKKKKANCINDVICVGWYKSKLTFPKSSSPAFTTMDRPITEWGPINWTCLSRILTIALPESSASMLPLYYNENHYFVLFFFVTCFTHFI